MGLAMAAKKLKISSGFAIGAPVTAPATVMLDTDAYCFVVPGVVLENIPLRGVDGRQRRTVLYPSRRASFALDGAILQARVRKITAKVCTRMEVHVNYAEKRRISQRTATYEKKMVGLVPCLYLFWNFIWYSV